jgi:NodT family efflux transporter outer membrane factor (OMF) lipoprotein
MKTRAFPPPISLVFASLLVGGCASSPTPQAKLPATPAAFAAAADAGATDSTYSADASLATWWRSFNDPVLDGLIARATEVNHDVRLARARVREARALAGIASAANQPTLDATGSATRARLSENSAAGRQTSAQGGDLTGNDFRAGFDASWELDLFGANRASIDAARAEADASAEAANATLIRVLAEVGSTYVELRGAQRELDLVNANLRLQQDTLALAEDRLRAGLADELPVAQARTQLAETRTRVPPLEAAIALATHRLGVLLDRAPADLALPPVADPLAAPASPPRVPLGLPSELLQRRPDILQAERAFAAANSRLASARADRWPRFYLTGAAGLESLSTGDLADAGSRFWTLGPGLRWPLLSGGRIRQTIAAQDARAEQAAIRYEQTVLRAFADVEDALVNFGRSQDRLAAAEDYTVSSRRTAALAADRHHAGLTDFLDVLAAERARLDADQLRVQSETATARNLIALYKALGGGWTG